MRGAWRGALVAFAADPQESAGRLPDGPARRAARATMRRAPEQCRSARLMDQHNPYTNCCVEPSAGPPSSCAWRGAVPTTRARTEKTDE